MFKMHSFLDLITAKKQSQFSVENCTTGDRYKGVRSQKLHKRTKIQEPSKPKNHNYRKRPNRRHHKAPKCKPEILVLKMKTVS